MKSQKYILFILTLLFCISCLSEKKAELFLLEDNYDFGVIKKDSIYNGWIIIKNNGNSSLIISDVNPDCTCTNVSISKDTILPKDTCLLKFSYSTYRKKNRQERSIWIFSNSKPGVKELKIRAYINNKLN